MSSPIKRNRRSKAEMDAIRDSIYRVVAEYRPMTVRQVFYQLVTLGVIDKTEGEYKGTVCRLLSQMRRDWEMPYEWIADNTRWQRKPNTHDSFEAAIKLTAETYRRNLWQNQDVYCEIWLEKEALAGVLYEETQKWDVPLMVTRGYPSLSFLYSAAQSIDYSDKEAHLYYFGDHDPSGVDIPRVVEERIREIAPDADFTFECVAVLPEHIESLNLQTRPTKRTDTRSKNFTGESVEVDAIDPSTLREMASDCIAAHIDADAWQRMELVEQSERESAHEFMERLGEIYGGAGAGQ